MSIEERLDLLRHAAPSDSRIRDGSSRSPAMAWGRVGNEDVKFAALSAEDLAVTASVGAIQPNHSQRRGDCRHNR